MIDIRFSSSAILIFFFGVNARHPESPIQVRPIRNWPFSRTGRRDKRCPHRSSVCRTFGTFGSIASCALLATRGGVAGPFTLTAGHGGGRNSDVPPSALLAVALF